MAVHSHGRGSVTRPRRVQVERSDAGMVEGKEESNDDGGVVVEDEVGGDGPVVEEEANDDGPVAEEDENVGGVAEQDQEASVGRAGEQDPDDNDRVARRRRPWGSTREPAPPARGPPRAPPPSFPARRVARGRGAARLPLLSPLDFASAVGDEEFCVCDACTVRDANEHMPLSFCVPLLETAKANPYPEFP